MKKRQLNTYLIKDNFVFTFYWMDLFNPLRIYFICSIDKHQTVVRVGVYLFYWIGDGKSEEIQVPLQEAQLMRDNLIRAEMARRSGKTATRQLFTRVQEIRTPYMNRIFD